MTRKQFLKICGAGIAGFILGPIAGWFSPKSQRPVKTKEALFYREAHDLAG